jgi:hypothetical protein
MMLNVSVKPVQKSAGHVLHAFTGMGSGTSCNICQRIGNVSSGKANGMTYKCHMICLVLTSLLCGFNNSVVNGRSIGLNTTYFIMILKMNNQLHVSALRPKCRNI